MDEEEFERLERALNRCEEAVRKADPAVLESSLYLQGLRLVWKPGQRTDSADGAV